MEELLQFDLREEAWREYDIPGREKPYWIEKPDTLYLRPGGFTHRVLDSKGVVHIIPGPRLGSVIRIPGPVRF